MNDEEPSPFTPEGQIERARRFGLGWRQAPRWKKVGLLLSPFIAIAVVIVIALIYVLVGYLKSFFG